MGQQWDSNGTPESASAGKRSVSDGPHYPVTYFPVTYYHITLLPITLVSDGP